MFDAIDFNPVTMNKSIAAVCLVVMLFCYACHDAPRTVTKTTTVYEEQDTAMAATAEADIANGAAAPATSTDTTVSTPIASSTVTGSDDHPNYADSVDFRKYAIQVSLGAKAPIDWSSNANAKRFKTRIINAYQNAVDFGGHYIGSVFGCGAGCVLGFMVDTRDGKIYDLPLGEENSCFDMQDAALFRSFSKLFISAVCKNSDDQKLYFKAYVWDEQNKHFDRVKEKDFLKKLN